MQCVSGKDKSDPEARSATAAEHFATTVGEGLRFVEAPATPAADPFLQLFWQRHARPHSACSLYAAGIEEPVSYLTVLRYTARFGVTSIPVEGYSATATHPAHRRKGFGSELIRQVIARSRERCSVAFLKGIDSYYGRFGFVPCIPQTRFVVSAKVLQELPCDRRFKASLSDGLVAAEACALYNRVHGERPGTVVRQPTAVASPVRQTHWEPGDEVFTVVCGTSLAAYAVITRLPFGQSWRQFQVREIVSADCLAAQSLLAAVGRRATEAGRTQVEIDEPDDSVVGIVLRRLTCEQTIRYSGDGGVMALLLNRRQFASELRSEWLRRFGAKKDAMVRQLATGELLPNDSDLLHLALGTFSIEDIAVAQAPARRLAIASRRIPKPFIHALDRY